MTESWVNASTDPARFFLQECRILLYHWICSTFFPSFFIAAKCLTTTRHSTPCVVGTWKWRGRTDWVLADSADGEAIGCANPDRGNGGLWCATKVDSDGIYQNPNWGYCNMTMEACNPYGETKLRNLICFRLPPTLISVPKRKEHSGEWQFGIF